MTTEQQNLINSLKEEASSVYSYIDELQVDYDKFKQVADASLMKANQSEKIYNRLYKQFIYYPNFIKSLAKVKEEQRAISNENQEILKEKSYKIAQYRSKYNDLISKVNDTLILASKSELAQKIQEIVNERDSLYYSYELVDEADKQARLALGVELNKDIITGTEVCLDKNGIEISMSICRPSGTGGGASSGSIGNAPSASEMVSRGVGKWLELLNAISEADKVEDIVDKDNSLYEKERVSNAINEEKVMTEEEKAIVEENKKIEDIGNQISDIYDFSVDLLRIAEDKKLAEQSAPSPRQQNLNYALCSSIKQFKYVPIYKAIGNENDVIDDSIVLFKGLINTTRAFASNITNSNLIKEGDEIRLTHNQDVYISATVVSYNPNGLIYYKINSYKGNDSQAYKGWTIEIFDRFDTQEVFVINNPYSAFNNYILDKYLEVTAATDKEIAIARAYCPTSQFAAQYYKK